MRRYLPLGIIVWLAVSALFPATTLAGTQDFALVNHTGFAIYEIYISETANDSWEEDVLGENILPNGGRLDIAFADRSACLWDIKVVDEDDADVTWTSIDLCAASVVVLTCNDSGECTAQWE